MNYVKKTLAGIWLALPIILGGIIVLNWWNRPAPGTAKAAPAIVVAGEAALTPEAEEWKKGVLNCPAPEPGEPDIQIVYRDPDEAELERLARKYAARIAPEEPKELAPEPRRWRLWHSEPDEPAATTFRMVFGEYAAPEMPYGGTFLPGTGTDGEFQAVFAPNGPPKARWTNVWGAGASVRYDSTGVSPDGLYAFWEPGQVKQIHGRIEGGAFSLDDGDTDLKITLKAEWRSEPWRRKAGHGLKAVKRD